MLLLCRTQLVCWFWHGCISCSKVLLLQILLLLQLCSSFLRPLLAIQVQRGMGMLSGMQCSRCCPPRVQAMDVL